MVNFSLFPNFIFMQHAHIMSRIKSNIGEILEHDKKKKIQDLAITLVGLITTIILIFILSNIFPFFFSFFNHSSFCEVNPCKQPNNISAYYKEN